MMEPFIRLVACRANAGKTMEEWAEALNVSVGTVNNWEKGTTEPSASQLMKISQLSKIPVQFIFVPEKSN